MHINVLWKEDYTDHPRNKDVYVHMTNLAEQEMLSAAWHGGLQGLARIMPGMGKEMCMCT